MSKNVKIIFSGICTYAPGPPEGAEEVIERLFVLAPQARKPRPTVDNSGIVSRHRAFVYVPKAYLDRPAQPALSLSDASLGECAVFLVDNARLTFDPPAAGDTRYVVDQQKRPVNGWPDTNGSAPGNDSRWVPDVREIFNDTVRLKFDPRGVIPNRSVSMVVELTGATIESRVPCPTAQPRTFRPAQKDVPPRVMSVDMVMTMSYPDDTQSVTLKVEKIDRDVRLSGIGGAGLALKWADTDTITLRMGNDTLDEIVAMRDSGRCKVAVDVEPDFDFDLHYDIMDGAGNRPLPTPSGHEGDWGGCVGLKVPLP